MGNVIEANNVGIEFAINRKRRLHIRDFFIHGRKANRSEHFWALRNVTFSIGQGEAVGIIGPNGSGKSTLLRLIAGVFLPDEGTMEIRGRVAPLLELSVAFSPQLSARENIYLSGIVNGMSRERIDERFEEIVSFAGLEGFIDTPVRHFSSGMKSRLGFSVIRELDHPIVLIDEALAVGDARFRRRCLNTLEEMIDEGRTLILVSHSNKPIKRFCTRALYVRDGALVADGPAKQVIKKYRQDQKEAK